MAIEMVYSDAWMPLLKALGDISIRRASEVEYDHTAGEWTATFLETGEIIARGVNRNDVIAAEVEWIQRRINESRR